MAVNIYHEAGNQSMIGQMAVGQVVLNRVADNRFPDTVCEVVKQKLSRTRTQTSLCVGSVSSLGFVMARKTNRTLRVRHGV